MALDYGEKRIGLALSDPLKIFAKPYRVLANLGFDSLVAELKDIIAQQRVDLLLVGIPYAIDGGNTPKTDETLAIFEQLKTALDVKIIGWDERYSSDEAHKELKKMGYSWQEARNLVDAMAAAMILKSYLKRYDETEDKALHSYRALALILVLGGWLMATVFVKHQSDEMLLKYVPETVRPRSEQNSRLQASSQMADTLPYWQGLPVTTAISRQELTSLAVR